MAGNALQSPEAAVVAELGACVQLMRRGGGSTGVLAVADRVAAMFRDEPGSPVLSAASGFADAAVKAAGSSDREVMAELAMWNRVLGLAVKARLVSDSLV